MHRVWRLGCRRLWARDILLLTLAIFLVQPPHRSSRSQYKTQTVNNESGKQVNSVLVTKYKPSQFWVAIQWKLDSYPKIKYLEQHSHCYYIPTTNTTNPRAQAQSWALWSVLTVLSPRWETGELSVLPKPVSETWWGVSFSRQYYFQPDVHTNT